MVHLYDIEVNLIAGLTTESNRIFGETVINTRRPHDEVLYVSGSRSFFILKKSLLGVCLCLSSVVSRVVLGKSVICIKIYGVVSACNRLRRNEYYLGGYL